jgi:hypothetical protein
MAKLTVFDNLPLDIIKFEIFPHLNYNERINLNLCLPPQDRISKRMLKASIEKHERKILVNSIKNYFDYHDTTTAHTNKQLKNITRMFTVLQKPRYFTLISGNSNFREVTINKIRELLDQLINFRVSMDISVRNKLVSELKKLRKKIDTSGPYTDIEMNASVLSFV